MSDFQQRFGGTSRLYGHQQALWLRQAHFCVVGIGGVGCWVAEALARTAVGKLTLIDLDDICTTNTNRQIHALQNTVGQSKVEVMAARIRLINPACQVNCIEDFVTPDNVGVYLNGFDYVIDATDSVNAKAAMIAHCKRKKFPVLTIGGAGGQTDPTQVGVADLSKTSQDPLAAKVRSLLRRDYGFTSNPKRRFAVDCVYSTEQLKYPQTDGTVCHTKQFHDGSVKLDCNSGFGAAVAVTGTFGFVAAARVIDKYLQRCQRQHDEP
ncbi:tRNA cyclic N6-threonylcarbamoyladenosine(37) synthase TcdA [Bowmanella denitrificans]|uniref:tRNA cyclic N6-threonylcarbamoyladenosine(37) synthase TcdA n=1 Tax=Bowmanella denitrificans TaxID=366582 RepID=A0ABP3H9R4_9ALTE